MDPHPFTSLRWRGLLASCIDLVLIGLPVWVTLAFNWLRPIPSANLDNHALQSLSILVGAWGLIICCGCCGMYTILKGGVSPGKAITSLRLQQTSQGAPAHLWQIVVREIGGKLVPVILGALVWPVFIAYAAVNVVCWCVDGRLFPDWLAQTENGLRAPVIEYTPEHETDNV